MNFLSRVFRLRERFSESFRGESRLPSLVQTSASFETILQLEVLCGQRFLIFVAREIVVQQQEVLEFETCSPLEHASR